MTLRNRKEKKKENFYTCMASKMAIVTNFIKLYTNHSHTSTHSNL